MVNEVAHNLLAPHRDAIIFYKLMGSWPGGDIHEIGAIARAFGMPENEISYNCSGCLGNMLNFIYQFITPEEVTDYKQRKGI